MTVAAAQPSMFAVFRKPAFTRLWFAQLISTIGSSLTDLAAAILIFRLTDSALAVGLILMASALPSLVFGLVAGVFVDRFDRKKILIWSDVIRAVLVVSIPTGVAAFGVAWLYVIVFVNARRLADGLRQLPDLRVDRDEVQMNIFFIDLVTDALTPRQFTAALKERGILVSTPYGTGRRMRLVTHYGITSTDIDAALAAFAAVLAEAAQPAPTT